mmetsp:Transcript_95360/g.116772  ORF Transcript_95360/g.116772 Transcript_95360/m.116772 type:complete len:556 (+) Transcript_95360:18-1685(+)
MSVSAESDRGIERYNIGKSIELESANNINGNSNYMNDDIKINETIHLDVVSRINVKDISDDDDIKHLEISVNNNELPSIRSHKSSSIRAVNSPRAIWQARDDVEDPSDNTLCLWILTLMIFVALAASLACTSKNFMMIVGSLGPDVGSYVINYGYITKTVQHWGNGEMDALIASRFILEYTELIRKDNMNLLLISCFICFCCVLFIIGMLCIRQTQGVTLYTKCCGIKIPQRASIYVMFSGIRTLAWYITMSWLLLSLYGMLELNYWITQLCTSPTCVGYMVPHYGWYCYVVISFSLACCAFKRVQSLDLKFAIETIKLYYPENSKIASSRNTSIKLPKVLDSLNCLRKIVLHLVIIWCFQNSSLLSVIVSFENAGTVRRGFLTFSAFVQPHGLSNKERYGPNSIVATDENAQNWVNIGIQFSNTILVLLLLNIILMIFYCRVIISYYINSFTRWLAQSFTFIQWFLFTAFIITYYIQFNSYWINNGKNLISDNPCQPLSPRYNGTLVTQSNCFIDVSKAPTVKNIFWFPDWGLILCIVCNYYMIKLCIKTYNAI